MILKAAAIAWVLTMFAWAQSVAPASAPFTIVSGIDAVSGIRFALISVEGKLASPAADTLRTPPRLTAQCTRNPAGKMRFELLADLGNAPDLRFVPPWKPSTGSDFPPQMPRATVTMEFLGYTRVKPVKRQWAQVDGLTDEWKYATPGMSSSNMEEIMFYLQYLKALPTLRLSFPNAAKSVTVVEFETLQWQQRLKAEPLCGSSSL